MYVAQERRAYILRLLQQRGSIRSAELARELGVTDETIRTDLVDMQAQGLLKRVHGGARYILPLPGSDAAPRPDCQLAQLACRHIKDGMRVYLDADLLALVLVSQLGELPCTLICNSPELLSQLAATPPPQQLVCPGGLLNKECHLLDSSEARRSLQEEYRPDIALLCPPALREDVAAYRHLCPPALREDVAAYRHPVQAAWAEAAARAAHKVIWMVPSQALYSHAPHAFALPENSTIITENNLPPHFHHPDTELIPYISAEDLIPGSSFDY